MTDFYAQLEEQLVAAGWRKHAHGRLGRAVTHRGRLLAAAVAFTVLVAGGAVALPALIAGSTTTKPAAPVAPAPAPAPDGDSLRSVRVAIFNATASPGLAREAGEQVGRHGALISVLGSVPAQPGGRSVVLYRPGAQAQARRVAAVLDIAEIEAYDTAASPPIPPQTTRATVIVLVGYDRDRSP